MNEEWNSLCICNGYVKTAVEYCLGARPKYWATGNGVVNKQTESRPVVEAVWVPGM